MDPSGPTWVVMLLEDGERQLTPVLEGTTLTLTYDGEQISGTERVRGSTRRR